MSGSTPPPPAAGSPEPPPPGQPASPSQPAPPNQPAWGQPDQPTWTQAEPLAPYQPPSHGRRGLKALVLSAVLVLLIGGGAFAFYAMDPFHVFRAGPQAAEALPANAIAYAGVDLDPKASQKVDALRFLNHFPAFHDKTGLADPNADILDVVIGKAVDDLDCQGTSYADDVRPWLGSRFGVALMPGSLQQDPPVAFAVQVNDDDAARKGIAELAACDQSPTGTDFGVAFDNGFMLVAPTQAQAIAYAKAADQHSLADDAQFKADMDALGDAGVASMWVDVKGFSDAFGDEIGGLFNNQFASVRSSLRDAPTTPVPDTRVAATFRFGSDHAELATVFTGAVADFATDANPVVNLPDSTVFALSASGLGPAVGKSWEGLMNGAAMSDPAIREQLQQFEDQTGIQLPGDLTTLFGRNLMLSVGDAGLDAETLGMGDPSKLDIGLRLTNDPDKLNAVYDKVQSLVEGATGGDLPLSKVSFEDGLAIATNQAYAQTLADLDGDLGDSGDFQSVISDGADQAFVGYFDFAAVSGPILQQMTESGEDQETIENLRPLRAFGITANRTGDYGHLTMRVSVND